jgi:hypothetical protein
MGGRSTRILHANALARRAALGSGGEPFDRAALAGPDRLVVELEVVADAKPVEDRLGEVRWRRGG